MTQEVTDRAVELAASLAEAACGFYQRGWALGTGGNFSAVMSQEPLRLLITASGMDKGRLTTDQFVQVDGDCEVVAGEGRPSDETKLHLTIVRRRPATAVLHTHSVWSTTLSSLLINDNGIEIAGYEMLKGLAGVRTHEHREWLPILDNSQDMGELASKLEEMLDQRPDAHGFLLRGHGLYTWGRSLSEARRHVEILEFLLEVVGRMRFVGGLMA
ncbi:MAG TPA: methylthioribulose 1-phosphate dehydratase [Blastocatellia bacterium]|nr:methylthioribulose 1-phosphate dehydratase [Blastocatellia bacterium]